MRVVVLQTRLPRGIGPHQISRELLRGPRCDLVHCCALLICFKTLSPPVSARGAFWSSLLGALDLLLQQTNLSAARATSTPLPQRNEPFIINCSFASRTTAQLSSAPGNWFLSSTASCLTRSNVLEPFFPQMPFLPSFLAAAPRCAIAHIIASATATITKAVTDTVTAGDGRGVRAVLEDGTEAFGDVLIGADGVWSQ
eukprot:3667090-Pleurochrysis_carterae.AAC.1